MIKIFQILIVMFGFAYANTSFAGATLDAARDKNALKVVVTDHAGKPVEGIKITTTNWSVQKSATTDKNGVAKFMDVCSRWAEIGRDYDKTRRKNPKTDKRPVRFEAIDTGGKYKKITGYFYWTENSYGCTQELKLSKDFISESFPTPEQLKLAFDNRTGKLKFYKICTSGKKPGGKIQSGCIDVFKDTNVQLNEGIYLAKSYMWEKIIPEDDLTNLGIECDPLPIRTQKWQDYLSCTSTGGKYAYDFEFDDLIESTDRDILTDTAKALCEYVYDGTFVKNGIYRFCKTDSAEKTQKICNEIRGATHDLSWTTEFRKSLTIAGYQPSMNANVGYVHNYDTTEKDICLFDFRGVGKNYKPKDTVDNKVIDITKYEYIEVRSLPSLEFLIRQYVEAQLGYKLDNFRCAKGFRQWDSPTGDKHLLDCEVYKDGVVNADGTPPVLEFVFDNINVRTELVSNAGEGGMNCIGTGGSFDGSNCQGLTRAQCTELDEKVPGGATWDEDIKQCTLNDAATLETLKSVGDAVLTGIEIAGAVVVIVGTAGTAAPAVAALAVAGGALAIEGTVMEKSSEAAMKDITEKFLQGYRNCKNQPVSEQDPCARSVLISYLGYIETFLSRGAFEGQYAKSLGEVFGNLIELTEPDKITEKDVKYYSLQKFTANQLVNIQDIGRIAKTVGDFAMIFAGGTAVVQKMLNARGISIAKNGTAVLKDATNASKTTRFFKNMYNFAKKGKNVAEDAHDVYDGVSNFIKVPSTTNPAACWTDGRLLSPCK